MEARILRPLVWFGLFESRTEPRSPTEVVDRRCTGRHRCLIVSLNSTFRSRAQAFAIRRDAIFSERGRSGQMDGGLWMNSTRPPVSDEVLPSPDLNDREHGKDHLSGETDRSGERSVGGKLIRERSTELGT